MFVDLKSKTPLADYIKKQCFNEKRNYYVMITGKTQTRKSTSGVKLAYEIQSDWDIHTQMACIKTKEMIKAMRLEGLKRGDALLLDEFGVGMGHRRWREFLVNAMNYLMMTHGFKGIVVIVTVPYESYIDSDCKKLFDMLIEVIKKHDGKRYVEVNVEEMQYNQKLKRIYYHRLRGIDDNGRIQKLDSFAIKYPSKDILEVYFELSESKKEELGGELKAQAEEIERDKISKAFSLEYYVDLVSKNPEKFMKEWHGRKFIAIEKIMNEFIGIGNRRALQIKTAVEEKLGEEYFRERSADT